MLFILSDMILRAQLIEKYVFQLVNAKETLTELLQEERVNASSAKVKKTNPGM